MESLRAIGYWAAPREPLLPDPKRLVDEDWEPTERDFVLDYLERGVPITAAMGPAPCRICGRPNGSADLTDGVFVWPEGLAHYVRDHAVRLPASFIRAVHGR